MYSYLKYSYFFFVIFLCLSFSFFFQKGFCQKNILIEKPIEKPIFELKGQFLDDSIKLGFVVRYALSVRHNADIQLFFPDSTHNYAPFTWVKKQSFPTITQKNISIDSAIYELTTFEIQKYQRLALPVWWVRSQDSTKRVWAKMDSVIFQNLVQENVFDTLKSQDEPKIDDLLLKANTNFVEIPEYFNYPYIIAIVLAILLVVLIIWGLLGQRITRAYQIFQFNTRHAIFLGEFTRLSNRITSRRATEDIEKAIAIWKKHLEQIDQKPFTSYTSKEITQILHNPNLADALKSIDKAIYGKEISNEITEALNTLKELAISHFKTQKELL